MRYRATILLGAFLLFQVQPQIAKIILPWFGGGPAVWSACLLFFQVLLLGGYAYAYALNRFLKPRWQAVLHVALLAGSLLCLPVVPGEQWKPTGVEDPTLHILLLLLATVGLSYLLLAATGPLLQSWFARETGGRSPYRLYALSNLGSLAALLSFPFVFEPNLTIGAQANAWSFAYVAFFVLSGACAWSFSRTHGLAAAPSQSVDAKPAMPAAGRTLPGSVEAALAGFTLTPAFASGLGDAVAASVRAEIAVHAGDEANARPSNQRARRSAACATAPSGRQFRLWMALAALPSVMLLAVTNVICVDIAVIPFFWVMPLAIYLVTFILTFESARWYRPAIMGPALAGTAVLLLVCTEARWFAGSVVVQAAAFCVTLFLCGMVCHGELVRRKPAPAQLTAFYLSVSAGGAIGGAFVAVAAPLLFNTYLEVEIGLGLCAVAGLLAWAQGVTNREAMARLVRRRVLPFALGIAFAGAIVVRAREEPDCIERSRNFFGQVVVQQTEVTERRGHAGTSTRQIRRLRHGSTLHGEQITGDDVESGAGRTYFGNGSGVAYALRNHPARARRPLRVGIIGLGTGTLACYAQQDDDYTFYEIDPAIVRIAETHFTYLADARSRRATTNIRLGDARIQLEREPQRGDGTRLDLLVVDAFSSDSIPVHLLTREASRIYWRHLAPDGILLVHVSNRYLDLLPVVRGLAADGEKELRLVSVRRDETNSKTGSLWAILTDNADFLAQEAMREEPVASRHGDPGTLLWTDGFSSLWHVIR